jgi:hypothetical protein
VAVLRWLRTELGNIVIIASARGASVKHHGHMPRLGPASAGAKAIWAPARDSCEFNHSSFLTLSCHKRRTFAMGGPAAQIPSRTSEEPDRLAENDSTCVANQLYARRKDVHEGQKE